MPKLAEQKLPQKTLFFCGGAGQQFTQRLRARHLRTRTVTGGDGTHGRIDIGDAQRGLLVRVGGGRTDRRRADADTALGQATGQIAGCRIHLIRTERSEALGEDCRLFQPAAGRGERSGCPGELLYLHDSVGWRRPRAASTRR